MYLQCFSSNLLLLFRLHATKRPHVVQPVRQFHNNYADFFCHCKEKLPQILSLDICYRCHARYLANLAKPGFPLDNAPDSWAKPLAYLLKGDIVCILNSIM